MKINFIGNFTTGYVGEVADQVHLAREMEDLGHTVQRVPQDIWKASCDGDVNPEWAKKLPLFGADINIITKWHHFNDRKYIQFLKDATQAPVFYWVWDFMNDGGVPQWHLDMVSTADLYLGNDVRNYAYRNFDNCYYFPFDVADRTISEWINVQNEKKYDVVFFGSCIEQGDRIAWLTEINKTHPVTIFSWNWQEWQSRGFSAKEAVYGEEFARTVSLSKICLGFSVEPSCWGYWSNRVGKTLLAGGFLLYQYAPGMELFLKDGVEYFSSVEEAREKINYFLVAEKAREEIIARGKKIGRNNFSSHTRVKELLILAERYIKTNGANWQY